MVPKKCRSYATFFSESVRNSLKATIIASEKCRENISSREQSNRNDDNTKVWLDKI